ncbi:cytosolic phospholipase A2 epsilon [Anolis carolinensis]|uniref:cytosolic phospholipase A2 epsilon n=1 Tax=Anolis carolinensis TaxID=28377 RepID=UPI00020380C8|nr:PREDICTED: cytosolic phospholipase A2 epsilon isoform X2 [Anolis carolinensis]|eukprot:XP_003214613.1 PREDICTED: cytosolic phospholipase A2 epsilon isoform X2 [Anolis carolinensis]
MGTTISSPGGHPNNAERGRQNEETPFRLLTVKVLRARNIQKADTFSETDCYVSLWLPTASSETVRTVTIPNSKDPTWNQTFSYRVDSRVKNILNLNVYDEDTFSKDDHLYTVLFDIGKLQSGQTSRVNFKLNPERHEELDVEFTLRNLSDHSENLITNGTMVAREISCLEIIMDLGKLKQQYTKGEVTFTIKGSYEETQKIPFPPDSCFGKRIALQFHCLKNLHSNLEITLPDGEQWSQLIAFEEKEGNNSTMILPLINLPIKEKITLTEAEIVELHVKAKDWTKGLDVRLEYDLCPEEKNFLKMRRNHVAPAVEKVLQLKEKLCDDEVPVVAIMTTGGGIRSFTAMYGSLLGLQKLNLLDTITYLTGLSGTTWTMGKLYEDPDWSQRYMEEAIHKAQKQVTKCKLSCFSMNNLKYYHHELKERTKEGFDTSFIDLWGLVVESMLNDGRDNHKLSNERRAVTDGQNPLPIYLAVSLKKDYSAQDYREWVEFTPYEVGSFKYGAYIRVEDFGSDFFMGRVMKRLPEMRICFMQGMWSSIFSLDFMFFWHLALSSEDFWHKWTRDRIEDIEDSLPSTNPHCLETRLVTPPGQLSSALRDVLTGRPTMAEYPNFLKGFQFNDDYLKNKYFSTWKDTVLDIQPDKLMETAAQPLALVDTGFFINTSYPPLLRPERKVDVILHLNYSGGLQTRNLDQFSAYAAEQGIPFPKVEISEEDRKTTLKECYVFEDKKNVDVPLVLFFPLTNDTYKKYSEPGVERNSENIKEGDVDVSTIFSPFTTREVCFSKANFRKLVNLTEYNVLNNEKKIVEALRVAVERRKQRKS